MLNRIVWSAFRNIKVIQNKGEYVIRYVIPIGNELYTLGDFKEIIVKDSKIEIVFKEQDDPFKPQ